MNTLVRDFGSWFWRLIPANPILVRVVMAGGRRLSHLWIRVAYLGILMGCMAVAALVFQSAGAGSLADMSKNATQVFKWVSLAQLTMVCVIAPIFAASAITQEKNSQTFNILLTTPLTNGQIVLGSLLSRLYFVLVLLAAGVPLFCIMMVYGGVTGDKIALAISLAACTAALTSSLAIAISVIKIGTGRTIFSFYLAIAVYLFAVGQLAKVDALIPLEAVPAPGQTERMSWLAAFHPFLAMNVAEGTTPAPPIGAVEHYGFPMKYWAAYPQYSYIVMTLLASVALIISCLFFVRRGQKEGEPTLFNRLFSRGGEGAVASSERTRKPRHVGANPVAWREAHTRVAAGAGWVMRYGILALGMILAVGILIYYLGGHATPAQVRPWICGMVEVELLIALFIATTTAATSMTREKESNTLSLLLCTPITSRQIIWGKVRGLISMGLPMLIAPYLTIVLFFLADLARGRFSPGGNPESVLGWEVLLSLPILFVAYMGVCCMWGLACSIKQTKTIMAVFYSIGMTMLVAGGLTFCGVMSLSGNTPAIPAVLMPFAPIYAVLVTINPEETLRSSFSSFASAPDIEMARMLAFGGSIAAAALWMFVGWGLLNSMVRNFDMTIRKQMA